ncbi:MAG: AMP-binding protein [Pseudomonadota bacterium]
MSRHWTKSYDAGVPQFIDADAYTSVVALLDKAVADFGDLPAFECFGTQMTYAQLDAKSRAVAAYLQQNLGIKRGDRVALMCPNIFAFPVAMMGILRAGATQVNVNPLYTPRELQHQLTDAGAETILIFAPSTQTLGAVLDQTPVETVITIDLGDAIGLPIPTPPIDPSIPAPIKFADVLAEGETLAFEPVKLTGDDTLFFQYTGGTTGLSKGAVLTHRNLIANSEQFRAYLPEASEPGREVVVGALPLYHIFGLTLSLCYMAIGAKIVLIPNPRDMDAFIAAIKDSKFSIMAGVNTLFAGLCMHPAFKEVDFSGYKVSIGGGAAVLEATSEAWKAITGHHIKEGYGLSETSPILCINPMSVTHFTGACGLPVSSTDIKLLDDNDQEVGISERGEICAAGPQIMKGYWNRDDANDEVFTADGYFRTGDIGVFDEAGYLRIVDRKKDMILVSGFNVYPNEIEAVVQACPGVAENACIGIADDNTGEAPHVFVVKAEGADLTEDQIIEHCRGSLTNYKLPRRITFLKDLPKSNVGKILRRELRENA